VETGTALKNDSEELLEQGPFRNQQATERHNKNRNNTAPRIPLLADASVNREYPSSAARPGRFREPGRS
jgi:hypothetical protein